MMDACDPAFLDWCRAHGLRTHGVAPAFVADGWRGVVATAALLPGDVLVAAPAALLMSGRSARRDAVLGPLLQQQQYSELSDHQVCVGVGWVGVQPLLSATHTLPPNR